MSQGSTVVKVPTPDELATVNSETLLLMFQSNASRIFEEHDSDSQGNYKAFCDTLNAYREEILRRMNAVEALTR